MNAHAEPSKSLPVSIEAEQAVLGACLLNNEAINAVSLIVAPRHFSDAFHQRIFERMLELSARGATASPISLKTYLGEVELPGKMTVQAYLARLATEAISVARAPDYALIVRDLAERREIMEKASALVEEARHASLDYPAAKLVSKFSEETRHIAEGEIGPREKTDDMGWRIVSELDEARLGNFHPELITSGWGELDRFDFYRPGDLIVTAGRPGMGKSIFATCAARRIADAGHGVLELPAEIGREQALCRHYAELAYIEDNPIHFQWIMNRRIHSKDYVDRVAAAVDRFNRLPLIVEDCSNSLSIQTIRARIRSAKIELARRGVTLRYVSIDHLDFIEPPDTYRGNRTQEIFQIAVGMKRIAQQEGVVINLFSQLSRETEKRDDKRPTLADLRNSGDLEQVADVVQFLFREEYYIARSSAYLKGDDAAQTLMEAAKGKLEAIRQKVRAGPTGPANLTIDVAASYIGGKMK